MNQKQFLVVDFHELHQPEVLSQKKKEQQNFKPKWQQTKTFYDDILYIQYYNIVYFWAASRPPVNHSVDSSVSSSSSIRSSDPTWSE